MVLLPGGRVTRHEANVRQLIALVERWRAVAGRRWDAANHDRAAEALALLNAELKDLAQPLEMDTV